MQNNNTMGFVTCATDPQQLHEYLLASPCLGSGKYHIAIYLQAGSAAAAFNCEMHRQQQVQWLIWVHQDVFLPSDWDTTFINALADAQQRFPRLAVAGLYGISGAGEKARRAGRLLDRGKPLEESAPLPCLVDSLDELLLAVRTDSGLMLDPALGFDFYGTDLVLQAQKQGLQAAVLNSWAEHWSGTPQSGVMPAGLLDRITASAAVFERKWVEHLPINTPCFTITKPGDVVEQCRLYAKVAQDGSATL